MKKSSDAKQSILISIAILWISFMFFMIIFGDKGLMNLWDLQQDRAGFVQKNEQIHRENVRLSREIKRLKGDIDYIESIARRQLKMVRKGEIIFQPKYRNATIPPR